MHSHEEEQALTPSTSHTEETTAMAPENGTKTKIAKYRCAPRFNIWREWHILSLILALAILVAIIVILRVYENNEQPHWKYMSLNTLLSWLSTVCKACILLPASATLSQLKWVWFAERKRPLSDLDAFDSASRGIYGSAKLLWVLRMRHLAVLGAFATILSIGVGPFVQNLVHYSSSLIEDTTSPSPYLANSSFYNSVGPLKTFTENPTYIDRTLKANVYNSIFSTDPGQPWSIPHYNCGKGNCTWEPVPSIAIRSTCSDISPSIIDACGQAVKHARFNCTVGIQNGVEARMSFNGKVLKATALTVGFVRNPIAYTNSTFPVIQRLEATEANTRTDGKQLQSIVDNHNYIATECTLQPIVRSVIASVNNSQYEEQTLAEWDIATRFLDKPSDPDSKFGYSLVPDENKNLGIHPGQNFTISGDTKWSIDYFISTIFSGYASLSSEMFYYVRNSTEYPYGGTQDYATEDILEALLFGNIPGCKNLETERFQCAMDNVARAMSKSFRDQAYVRDKNTTNMARGTMKTNAIIVHIHWQWLTLPLLLWLLTAVVWAGAAWKTQQARVPKWYGNPLPLLFLYRDAEGKTQKMEGGLSAETYAQGAKQIEAQLHTKDNKATFIVSN